MTYIDKPIESQNITISKSEYQRLLDNTLWLECLEAAGVDNWQGYDDARAIWREEKDND